MESSQNPLKISLSEAVRSHLRTEKASFHTPGHKGRLAETAAAHADGNPFQSAIDFRSDLTELPGLDDLSSPEAAIKRLEETLAGIWKAKGSLLSVNGASAGIIASILAVASRGTKILVPRNAHRSVISALVLSGLSPVWYAPEWNSAWQLFGPTTREHLIAYIDYDYSDIAAVVVVSPTYAGAISDIADIANFCHQHEIPLIVDEAHGAHFSTHHSMPVSATGYGADIVVQSLHKTFGALTQTGLIHLPPESMFDKEDLRPFLNMVQSTSPSYPLLLSIEKVADQLSSERGREAVRSAAGLGADLTRSILCLDGFTTYDESAGVDPLHIVISHKRMPVQKLHEFLIEQGIYSEAILGSGILFLLGIGSTEDDVDYLIGALRLFDSLHPVERTSEFLEFEECGVALNSVQGLDDRHLIIEQMMTPRAAALAPSHLVSREKSENRIASECIAPCPPGIPLCVPGQRLTKEVLKQIERDQIRIVS